YMSRPLVGPFAPDARENDYTWRHYGQYNEEELASVIAQTYQQSLDCRGLAGVRKLSDVIVSHKTSGLFRPQAWWIATSQGRPAGCILINDYIQADSADVVYLGVTPEFRGRGLAAVMLNMAGRFAIKRGMGNLTLAVDSANTYAYKVYLTTGFQETTRRQAYAMIGQKK
ncbi:MAG: GNAT family N-acetyltransferase, partial [Planctomycetaceae bacterium]